MKNIKVTFSDGSTIYTSINGTEDEIRAYYIGNSFNIGRNGWEDYIVEAIRVEFL